MLMVGPFYKRYNVKVVKKLLRFAVHVPGEYRVKAQGIQSMQMWANSQHRRKLLLVISFSTKLIWTV